jgi:hypothetical protein
MVADYSATAYTQHGQEEVDQPHIIFVLSLGALTWLKNENEQAHGNVISLLHRHAVTVEKMHHLRNDGGIETAAEVYLSTIHLRSKLNVKHFKQAACCTRNGKCKFHALLYYEF